MFVLEVIPFSRTAPQAPLSYRSSSDLSAGTLVLIPLRKKILPGLVISSIPVRDAKAELKTASFSLSKSAQTELGQLPRELMIAAQEIAAYHATTLGAVLSTLLIPVLPSEFPSKFEKITSKKLFQKPSTDALEIPFVERCAQYEKWIQASVKLNAVTLLVVPTQTEVDEWALLLKAYKPLVVSGKVTGKRREAALARAPHAHAFTSLVITTPSFSWLPIVRLDRIILERVSAGSYTFPKRPYLSARYALTALARARATHLAYGDYPLPLEYRPDSEAPLHTNLSADIGIIDVRKDKTIKGGSESFQAIPESIRTQIGQTIEQGGRAAVLAVRRGYSPTVVCKDCGTAVTDGNGRALSLATVQGTRMFRSSDGSVFQNAEVFCKVCGGWNLMPLGVGVERVEEELRTAFPEASIVRIDQDMKSIGSLKHVRGEITKPGAIVIGTELMLSFLSPYLPVELGVIASADALLALPFWRARERFIRIGQMLGERSLRTLVATRHPEDAAVHALDRSLPPDVSVPTFWQEETLLRKTLSYPPFGTLIVFHTEGSAARLAEARASILSACAPYTPYELPERPLSANFSRASFVLKLQSGIWPDAELSLRLASLSPAIRLEIDSEAFW
jgi:primosomal protein N'